MESTRVESDTAVVVSDVVYTPEGAAAPVLEELRLSIQTGEHVAVIGRSGCGKTTALSVIAGLLTPDAGTVRVLDHSDPAERVRSCALMPQGDSLLPWLSLVDNVAMPLRNRGVSKSAAREQVRPLVEQWGLGSVAHHRPHELSGGMRQRAALLRALAADKPVLLADEPLGALDAITRADGQTWLRERLRDRQTTLVLVTHDVDEALLLADRVLVLAGRPARVTAESRGWFGDPRSRTELLADVDLAAARTGLLTALSAEGAMRR
ncbi:ABC transporter ATP-binding protein [Pseudoclavibacter sp. CFCC 13611]|uniref:ABC transporter ATP-binding protein n=1 Tax=Pseudoclavibacter sp. CFCC 13611 TaxID=2615178 RepID=UPI00130196EF|nr:ATP-binding cassette domain-containing protein [Pseudoclavibacter sp. CFCC 13611]KAB1663680.1 ATP-binding cassette domain-containing protein [Pseudoclavibacter sp. CFCC 13611]KAB1664571.1 ATP-binding cassette domain-containing protein [Pseudoclavibacter sp. CFCC 13611]